MAHLVRHTLVPCASLRSAAFYTQITARSFFTTTLYTHKKTFTIYVSVRKLHPSEDKWKLVPVPMTKGHGDNSFPVAGSNNLWSTDLRKSLPRASFKKNHKTFCLELHV